MVTKLVIARRYDEAIPSTLNVPVSVQGIASFLAMTSSTNNFNISNNNEQKTTDEQSNNKHK
jgi:hypothetical protein